jgi:hypothetical protein
MEECILKHITYLLLILLTTSPALSGDLYRWVDRDGTVNLSDNPPPATQKNTETRFVAPANPPNAKNMRKGRMETRDAAQKVSPEIAEMEIAARAQQRRHDKMQLQLKLKLLEAQGQPANSLEAYNLKMAYADDLRRQGMERVGAEAITILQEAQQMYFEIGMSGAVYDYKK